MVGSGGYFGKGARKSEKGGLVASWAAGGRGLQVGLSLRAKQPKRNLLTQPQYVDILTRKEKKIR